MTAPRVSRRSIADGVSEAIRDMILTGELLPTQRVTHDELARLLGVSTMPVREALLRLSSQGLIEARPNRSFRVAATSREDLADIYWMHGVLAGELTARACERATQETIEELQSIQEEWRALGDSEPGKLEELNGVFHRTINLAAGSPKLLVLLRNTLRFIPEHFYALVPTWSELSLRGHQSIIEAIVQRDPDAARVAARRHVEEAGGLLTEYFHERGYWSTPTIEATGTVGSSA